MAMTKGRTKAELAVAIRKEDPSLGCARRMAELAMGGCDYDETTQRLIDTYAGWLGIGEPDEDEYWSDDYEESEYWYVCEIANEHMSGYLTESEDDEEDWEDEE